MKSSHSRRQFLQGSGLALGAVTSGTLTGARSASVSASGRRCAWFGWELNLNNNDSAVYFEIQQEMKLKVADVDLAYTITSPPDSARFAEVLCLGGVTRGAPPDFTGFPFDVDVSPDFGDIQISKPQNLYGADPHLLQDVFYSVILKSWIPRDGTGSATWRYTHLEPDLCLSAGDYVLFTMGGDGPPADVEMQVVLGYTLGCSRTEIVTRP